VITIIWSLMHRTAGDSARLAPLISMDDDMTGDTVPRPVWCRPALLLLATLAVSAGCEGTTEPEHPTVTGNWVGTSAAFGALENWSLRMEESSDGGVTGTFSLRVERLVFSGTLSGTHTYPDLHLDFHMVFFGDVVSGTYSGQVTSPTTITGGYRRFDDPTQSLDLERLGP